MNNRINWLGLPQVVLAIASACAVLPAVAAEDIAVTPRAVAQGYGELVHASYQDTLNAAHAMQVKINAFLTDPSEQGLMAARQAWRDAREFYGQTEAFRFYGGPIDSDKGPEGRVNAWPMDESFVDYVEGKSKAGLINQAKFKITRAALIAQNERGGEENISTGWHAIEFLLWGQDLSADGPGKRPYTDYVDGKGANAKRRALYLKTVTDLLVDDLASLEKAWAAQQPKNYRARFEAGGLESVRKIFVGLGSLSRGELAGERLEVALFSKDQEDEHSCFSDNTHRDAVTNAKGILNVWQGQYVQADGKTLTVPSLAQLVAAKNKALADKTTAQVRQSVERASAIQAPFDREIAGAATDPGPLRVKATIDSLVKQSELLVESASAVGIKRLTLSKPSDQ
jgi:putative iron-regulated protein